MDFFTFAYQKDLSANPNHHHQMTEVPMFDFGNINQGVVPNSCRRWVPCLFIGLFMVGQACATVPSFTLSEGGRTYFLTDSLEFLHDPDGHLTLEKLLGSPGAPFTRFAGMENPDAPCTIWSRIELVNKSGAEMHLFFRFYEFADSVWAYPVEDGAVTGEQFSGAGLRPSGKYLRTTENLLPFSLGAGAAKVFYFKMFFSKNAAKSYRSAVQIIPARPLINFEIEKYGRQFFYAGIMMLFCLVSVFMFFMFRERVFLYFALLMLAFTLYFLKMRGIADALVSYRWRNDYVSIGQLTVSLVIVSLFLFSNRYLGLPQRMPQFQRFYAVFTLLTALFAHAYRLLTGESATYYHNFLLLVWILLTLWPIIFLLNKKDKNARILSVSALVMIFGAIINILATFDALPSNNWTGYSYQIGTVFFSGVLFYGLFEKINDIRSQKQHLEELDRLKSRFFANISHEFRTPLTLMIGPLEQLLESTENPENKGLLEMAHRNANRQLRLVNQLLDLSKLEAGKMTLQAAETDFVAFLKGIVHSYESLARQKNIAVQLEVPEGGLNLYFDLDKMEKILLNILSNAFKFTPSGGQVAVLLKKKNDTLILRISDTGKGISEENLSRIFDRFFQVDMGKTDLQEGSGIGLHLAKELIQLHGGDVQVESQLGRGTTFTLQFPLGKKHLQLEEIVDRPPHLEASHPPEDGGIISEKEEMEEETPRPGLPHILIVEDNEDVRAFIRQRLETGYQISEATDGADGILKALDLMPDLVISDVMMPEKDGYEVCKTLKTDHRTSHIPIILLTAKATQSEKLEGLETGADAYLVKPFDAKELLARVQNLIRLRRQLRERFAESISLKPSELTTNSVDRQFLENALQIVEANLADETFGIETLAHEIGMSRPNLNRKFRALVNQSTNQFIQSVRLQRAADLLRQQAGTVSEIAFQTGFGSPTYFVKCFRERFGETPGSYLKNE